MKFSIIIPVYNAAHYLRAAIESVVSQSDSDWECICVDDGSTDESAAVLDSYATLDSRIKTIRQENKGVSSARNKALELARGEWVVFLDADDVLRPSLLEDVATVAEQCNELSLIAYGVSQFGDKECAKWPTDKKDKVTMVDCSREVPSAVISLGLWQIAYKRKDFVTERFPPISMGEDLVFVGQCLAKAGRIAIIIKDEYGYRLSNGSACRTVITPVKVKDTIDFRLMLFRIMMQSNKSIPNGWARTAGNQLIESIPSSLMCHSNMGDWASVWGYWLDSMREVCTISCLSRWQRFVARCVSVTRSRLMVRLLCLFPHKMKKLGFHR